MKKTTITALCLLSLNVWADLDRDITQPIRIGITDNTGSEMGLSFIQPNEHGWNLKRKGAEVSLEKFGETNDEGKQIEGYIIRLDSPVEPLENYMAQIKKNTYQGYKNTRFNIKNFDVKPDPNHARCVRMHLLLEDRKPVRTVDHDQKKYSEQYTLSCGLEKHKGMGVELRLYDRYYEQNKDVKLAEVANTLFDSIVIDDK